MKTKNRFLHLLVINMLFLLNQVVLSQHQIYQSVRGQILDADAKIPLIGASLIIEGIDPLTGTISDVNGNFRFDSVPVGRYNFSVSYVGYEPLTVSEVLVSSAKEVVLPIELKESHITLDEVVVTSNTSKDRPSNSMAMLSARSFSVEETSRYAGGLDDPARLAAAFAGVTTTQTTNNAIIIRGNSPRGVLWRFEGVDIPAAFHFPNVDFIGGGGFTILSNQMLRNSDFYTGAFPAEYGNAVSGVFDIKMRTGNSNRREHTVQISTLGSDIASEGPFVKGGNATYLFNYRYSTLGLIGPLMNFPNLPTYQDLSFKFDFPTQKAGIFTLWGLGAGDKNQKTEETDSTLWENDISRMSQQYKNHFGAAGVSHRISLGTETYIHSSLSVDAMRFHLDKRELNQSMELLPTDDIRSTEGKYSFRTTLNHKLNRKVFSRTGITINSLFFDNRLDKAFRNAPQEMITFVDKKGGGVLIQAFSHVRMDLSSKLTAHAGFHSMYLDVNQKATLEPRLGLTWRISQKNELSAAYGLHAQMEELRTYFSQTDENGGIQTPNKHLDFLKSNHMVLGYAHKINEVTRVKIEPYFQVLRDIPVLPNTSFSIINLTSDWAINQKLENSGTGKNYGIDVTLERFLKAGYYYLLTGSLFDSKYTGGDGKEYHTRFNRGFVLNALAGKEVLLDNQNILGISAKLTYMGGLRYTPALYDASISSKMYIPDDSRAFTKQFPSSTGLDITISYRINKARYSGIWSLMLKNALLQPDYSDPFYDLMTQDVIIDQMKMPIPSLGYKIEF